MNAVAIEPPPKFHWNGVALDALTAQLPTLYLFHVDGYEKGKHVTSAVVVAEDRNDAINLVYVNQDLTTALMDIEVKLLGVAVSGVERQVVLNTAI
jgi:hypothetical protein